MARFLNELNNF